MPIYAAGSVAQVVPLSSLPYAIGITFGLLIVRSWATGSLPLNPRPLHGQTVVVTGGCTPITVSIMEGLANQGAQIILLAPDPGDGNVLSVVEAMRTVSNNERIYVERATLSSMESLHNFVQSWSSNAKQKGAIGENIGPVKLAGVIFCPEIDINLGTSIVEAPGARHYLFMQLMNALRNSSSSYAPRIINLVDPFYAAAPKLPPANQITSIDSLLTSMKGQRQVQGALAMLSIIVFNEHQRKLDEKDKNNRLVVNNVSTGLTRTHISHMICPTWKNPIRVIIWALLFVFLYVFAKSDAQAGNNILCIFNSPVDPESHKEAPPAKEEGDKDRKILNIIPGAFYRDGRVVRLSNNSVIDEDLVEMVWKWEDERSQDTLAKELKEKKSKTENESQDKEEKVSEQTEKEKEEET